MRAYDPAVKAPIGGVEPAADPYSVCEGAEVLVVLTEWDEFRWLDFDKVAGLDGRARASSTPATCSTGRALERRGLLVRRHRPLTSAAGVVVVTGGAGFLGSHLCDALLDRGDEVVAIDNLITGSVDNIEHLFGRPGFTFVQHDVSQYVWVPGSVDAVLHFASPASPVDFERSRSRPSRSAASAPTTASAWPRPRAPGSSSPRPARSTATRRSTRSPSTYWGHVNPVGPRGVYDEAKRFAEAMTMAYHRYHGLDVRIVRIFNTYGPRLRHRRRACRRNFLAQALHGKPLTVYGDGSQTRSFCYVDDEVRGFLALLDGDITGPVNIGNPDEFTIRELAEMVIEVTGSSSEIVYEPLPVDDPTQRQPDITLARERARLGAADRAARGPRAHGRLVPPASGRLGPRLTAALSGRGPRPRRGGPGTSRRCGAGPRRTARRPGTERRGGPAGVDPAPGLAVGLGRVPADLAGEAGGLGDELDQVADRQLLVGAQVDRVGPVVALGGQHDALGGVVDVEELAATPRPCPTPRCGRRRPRRRRRTS